ncbi:ATP-dependent RNA helicase DDX51 [Lepeophtheirus salmonis]|uniref:ATP-dependent RNA helicase DDX51 n=1 Tax=Lepeophtheirus salmonis TaxID=72036 RepID=UPI001AE30118|nr:ATP-dependent RNA helicase DDX51-like [Lepeophtheirus salmonis]
MILGADSVQKQSKKKARRILPRWLAEPNIISDDLKDDQMLVCDIEGISESLRDKLKNNGIRYLFPVQRQIVPHLLDSSLKHYYRPSDICVSAPTGSGKTLAFVLPIVQALQNRVVPRIRALVILPVQDLALQIYKVFKSYTAGEKLKVILLSSGQGKNVKTEQSELVCKGLGGDNDYHSLVDIIIATPGRLVEHLHNTPGFSLQHLRYLIIDEADKVMEDVSNDWLSQVEAAVYSGVNRRRPGPLTVKNANMKSLPLQKLLFSATLSQSPEKLQELNLYEPKLFCSYVKPKDIVGKNEMNILESFTTPMDLSERYVSVHNLMNKPLVLKKLLDTEGIKNCLIFVKSIVNAHFLTVLLRQYGVTVGEMSSNVKKSRKLILDKFKKKKIDYLVCTDALARGIDIGIIDNVISYDSPRFIKTYIHRVGRTARAGKPGTAYTLIHEDSEKESFKEILEGANKDFDSVVEYKIDEENLDMDNYELIRSQASKFLHDEKNSKRKKGRRGKNVKNPIKKDKMIDEIS